jgi:hypothetical protein
VFVNVTELIQQNRIEELRALGIEKVDIEVDDADFEPLHDEDNEDGEVIRCNVIIYNDVVYQNTDLVPWDVAIEARGFYFERARWLGLPNPPALVVFDDQVEIELLSDEHLKILSDYQILFDEYDTKICTEVEEF